MSRVGFLHGQLWQRLPRRLRRSALFHCTALLAPRPSLQASARAPVIVAGALRSASGLGESARLCHDALKAAGVEVYGIDLTSTLMQPEDLADFAFVDGREVEEAGTLILHVNSPLLPLAMLKLGASLVRNKRVIGYWAWELPRVPADWRHGMPFVHEIWVPSGFTADAIRPRAGNRPVRVMGHPIAVRNAPQIQRRRPSNYPFTVLTIFDMGSSFARKNPCAAIQAFRLAFGNDERARLTIKCSNAALFPKGLALMRAAIGKADNIKVIDRIMPPCEVEALYSEADAVLSLHRSEGFGLIIAEAMLRGLPVVATDWSGNRDFLTVDTGCPIGYRLVPAHDPQETYDHPDMLWPEADVEEAARALKELGASPQLRETLGQKAAAYAKSQFGIQNYGKRFAEQLQI
jgi:glycosyltransferase involved in cell wall biosynthesis